jgi:hypothetical protein
VAGRGSKFAGRCNPHWTRTQSIAQACLARTAAALGPECSPECVRARQLTELLLLRQLALLLALAPLPLPVGHSFTLAPLRQLLAPAPLLLPVPLTDRLRQARPEPACYRARAATRRHLSRDRPKSGRNGPQRLARAHPATGEASQGNEKRMDGPAGRLCLRHSAGAVQMRRRRAERACCPPTALCACMLSLPTQLLKEQLELVRVTQPDGRTRHSIRPIEGTLNFEKARFSDRAHLLPPCGGFLGLRRPVQRVATAGMSCNACHHPDMQGFFIFVRALQVRLGCAAVRPLVLCAARPCLGLVPREADGRPRLLMILCRCSRAQTQGRSW